MSHSFAPPNCEATKKLVAKRLSLSLSRQSAVVDTLSVQLNGAWLQIINNFGIKNSTNKYNAL